MDFDFVVLCKNVNHDMTLRHIDFHFHVFIGTSAAQNNGSRFFRTARDFCFVMNIINFARVIFNFYQRVVRHAESRTTDKDNQPKNTVRVITLFPALVLQMQISVLRIHQIVLFPVFGHHTGNKPV